MTLRDELLAIDPDKIRAEAVALFSPEGADGVALTEGYEQTDDYASLTAGFVAFRGILQEAGFPQTDIENMRRGAAVFALILTRYADAEALPSLD